MKKQTKKLLVLLVVSVVAGLIVNWLTPIDIPGAVWTALKWINSLFVAKLTLPVWALLLLILAFPILEINRQRSGYESLEDNPCGAKSLSHICR